jgi:2-desacetyl-2-hydroxyethyl bacteriochlorophyllide A dehydrogenase
MSGPFEMRQDQPAAQSHAPASAPGARGLWYVAPRSAELRAAALPAPKPGEVLVRMLYSGISRGTERLVFEGRLPESEWTRMRLHTQEGDFPFPVKYGYAAVGEVEVGPAGLIGKAVFALHPHQERFVLPAGEVVPLPGGVPPRRAVLGANMETALNALWDSRAAPCDRIVVIGGGLVGLMAAALAASMPGTEATLVDIDAARAPLAAKMGAAFAAPDAAPRDADVVIHTSANPAGLALALDLAGREGTIVEASWYGDKPVSVPLGGAFHSRRLKILSSQVGSPPTFRRPRWNTRRRLEAALKLLADPRYDALLGEEIAFADLPAALPRVLAPDAAGVGAYVRY